MIRDQYKHYKIKNINNYETVACRRKHNRTMVALGTTHDQLPSLPSLLQ